MEKRRFLNGSKARLAFFIVLSFAVLLTLCFIWGNSMLPKQESAEVSGSLYETVKPTLDKTFGEGKITHGIFRKMAHATEFMILSLELNLLFLTIKGISLFNPVFALASSAGVAAIDETIQIFSNRGPAVTDVLIDCGGAAFPAAAFFIIYAVILFVKRKKKKYPTDEIENNDLQ